MRKFERTLAFAAVIAAALLTAPSLYAHDNHDSADSPMGGGMMGNGGMMGRGNMGGRMSRMMEHCGGMMQRGPRSSRPNDQWRKDPPATPDKND